MFSGGIEKQYLAVIKQTDYPLFPLKSSERISGEIEVN